MKRIMVWLLCAALLLGGATPCVLAETGMACREETPVEEGSTESAPAEQPEAPAEEPEDVPVAENPEVPVQEPTVAPTAEAEPTVQPTAEPTSEPAAEPTAEPAAEPTQEPEVEPTAAPTAEPTTEPTAVPEQTVEELNIRLKATVMFGYAKRRPIEGNLTISGGVAPYTVSYTILRGGHHLETLPDKQVSGSVAFSYLPSARGYYRVSVTVEDAVGSKRSDSFDMRVAEKDHSGDDKWIKLAEEVELTGIWGEDLLNIALSQLGNKESEIDFIITGDGVKGYTIYGSESGGDYREWCSAFVQWCAGYMDVSSVDFPTDDRSRDWKKKLINLGAYVWKGSEYEPQPGDLIFFNHEKGDVPQHIGIVEKVEDGVVYTVEGNNQRSVRRDSYDLNDREIIGYGNVTLLQRLAEEKQAEHEKEKAQSEVQEFVHITE